jgi:hypothetical protein
MKIFHRIVIISIIPLAVFVSGCSRWRVESTDGPLNGPGSQSSTFLRQKLQPEGWFDERAWSHRSGRKVKVYSIVGQVDSYCESLAEYGHWTRLQAYIDDKQLRFAPARFWIVSIDPIAVIMTPFSVSNPDSHSLRELCGATDWRRALVSSVLANSYNYGSSLEASTSLQWFVVGSSAGLSTQRFEGVQLTLSNPEITLILSKKGNMMDVRRVSK